MNGKQNLSAWRIATMVAFGVLAATAIASARAAQSPQRQLACNGSEPEYTLDEKIAGCTALIARNPDSAASFNNRGNAYKHKGQYELAIADYNHAIELRPNYAYAFYNRGLVYAEQGSFDQAIADFTRAIALRPGYPEAFNNRGNAYLQKGNFDHAIADYQQSLLLNPDNKKAAANLRLAQDTKAKAAAH